ncbi:MAG: cytochrome family protein [Myxococcaceae bacterium]|nr:cytochrome family protein [Myxococcaceae bacterium]
MNSSTDRLLLWPMLAAFAAAGCGVVRPTDHEKVCPSYEAVIRPVLQTNCANCHSGANAGGGYVIGEHASTVSRSDDGTPRVAPGVVSSPFLEAARGKLPGHPAISADDLALLDNWVVACRAAPRPHDYHPIGWATSTDPLQFHGGAVRDAGYDFAECKSCHGEDLRGGKSGFDCNSCHQGENGPLACDTCHGDKTSPAPPKNLSGVRLTTALGVGAHRSHVEDGKLHRAFGCGTCHNDIKKVDDEGHYRRAGKFFPGPATVRLPSTDGGTARWDRTTATCTNVACHAPNKSDTAPTKFDPVWTSVGKDELKCGGCHGFPPSTHADNRCEVCHAPGYAGGGVDLALHLNGKVDLRGGGEQCDACHSGPGTTPFVDLKGRTADAGVQSVGAHDAHLRANKLRGPLACDACHLVPLKVDSPGHIDDAAPPATVFPPGLGGLASAQGATPVYNAANATCGSVYCHGGGVFPFVDTAPGLLRTPKWTGGPEQAACGTCHGLPPIDGSLGHTAAQTQPCTQCHGGTVSADGGIVFTSTADGGRTTKHMDGKVTGQ